MSVQEKISIADLNEFDRNYLSRYMKFSIKDSIGRDRNKGQTQVGRQSKGTSAFEIALTAITHQIMRRCFAIGVDAIATYHINKFVLFKESDANIVTITTSSIMFDFIQGKEFDVKMADGEFNRYSKVSQNAYIETVNNVIENGTADST